MVDEVMQKIEAHRIEYGCAWWSRWYGMPVGAGVVVDAKSKPVLTTQSQVQCERRGVKLKVDVEAVEEARGAGELIVSNMDEVGDGSCCGRANKVVGRGRRNSVYSPNLATFCTCKQHHLPSIM